MKESVRIVIPIYRALKHEEQMALRNNLSVLSHYPATFIYPEGFDIEPLHSEYPRVDVLQVSNRWLGTLNGIQGYNEMMMSADFYNLFADDEFIFICHVDAWVFRDELSQWCQRGYDLVAAPWPTRERYKHFPLKQYLQLKMLLKPRRRIIHCQMFGRIGNGGLCLRRVSAFKEACLRYADEIDYYNHHSDDLHNEDLFWALVPKELRMPTVEEALEFSFDLKPRLCYKQNGYRLPMACHGFNKPGRTEFWKQFITDIM